jgi:hypothetical protein
MEHSTAGLGRGALGPFNNLIEFSTRTSNVSSENGR